MFGFGRQKQGAFLLAVHRLIPLYLEQKTAILSQKNPAISQKSRPHRKRDDQARYNLQFRAQDTSFCGY